ncbi:MAG: protein tyrosine phosphatase [Bacteroidota bacterium]|nr:protein tyrosine phosphatase [Bacteroidota bacterium]
MKVLFVCSRNQWRSPTAENIYKKYNHLQVRSAGTEPSARVKLTAKTIIWADIIFAMEKRHKLRIQEKFPIEAQLKEIIVLDIADEYKYMDEELIREIQSKVDHHLGF